MPDLKRITSIVQSAGDQFLHYPRVDDRDETRKDDGSLVTRTDAAIQDFIQHQLNALYSDIAFVGEEMAHETQMSVLECDSDRLWVLDPLDGTTNFVAGFPFYGISLALIENGKAALAVIHDPVRGETFTANRGQGAFLNNVPIRPRSVDRLSRCVANIDYKRLTRSVAERLVRSPPYQSQRNLGSCVLEWCWLAAGRFHLYLHGGQKLWDFAAGSLILEEAGGRARTFEGERLDCESLMKRSVIGAVSPELQRLWSAWIFRDGCLEKPAGRVGAVPGR
ncbi:MAG: phosphatase [marine bacterium B5-7]|nr:MAG: phosphatase [marine bacterium B5-7]